jgi:hypothetical protein
MFSVFGAVGSRCCTLSGLVPDGTVVEMFASIDMDAVEKELEEGKDLIVFSVFVQGSSV